MSAKPAEASPRVRLCVGAFQFTGRLETESAPLSTALLASLLPIERSVLHARWSGEAAWVPLGPVITLEPENATAYPQPGQVLLYAGARSEPELLIPYGACAFASRAGALAGNPVIALDADPARLREMGELLLWQGAQMLRLDWIDEVAGADADPARGASRIPPRSRGMPTISEPT